MIFCENPESNEPGHSYTLQPFSPNSGFNQKARNIVVNNGLLDWAQNPPKLWKDVAALHFKKNGDKILQMVGQWALASGTEYLDDRSRRMAMGAGHPNRPIRQVALELQKELQAYNATYQLKKNLDRRYAQQQPVYGMYSYGGGRFGGGGMGDMRGGPMSEFGAGS
jgi:baculoviral IAP repeat-containing protein 6